jgi:hypothetical protein
MTSPGSSNLWVGATTKFTEGAASLSTGDSFQVSYCSGDVSGTEYTDTVSIGGATVSKQSISVARSAVLSLITESRIFLWRFSPIPSASCFVGSGRRPRDYRSTEKRTYALHTLVPDPPGLLRSAKRLHVIDGENDLSKTPAARDTAVCGKLLPLARHVALCLLYA